MCSTVGGRYIGLVCEIFLLQIDIYTPLKAILIKAWAVWELVLLAQPLMVAARSPGEKEAISKIF